jgi:hypothetical protein
MITPSSLAAMKYLGQLVTMQIYTLENHSKSLVVVGYVALAMFLLKGTSVLLFDNNLEYYFNILYILYYTYIYIYITGSHALGAETQPTSDSPDGAVVLNEGAHQCRLYRCACLYYKAFFLFSLSSSLPLHTRIYIYIFILLTPPAMARIPPSR